ncbi:response regulator [Szabonella alba]|uniref:Response regulator n=1 Tax=Szabonella alba TaxID=2804194 RepID=A0A8K0V623_9RHOB|nr:response regulator [Szabonella alba]MBL4915836.1 response regulator [Szabonella alba]
MPQSAPQVPPGSLLPLAGLTLLTVEDSRFASEAMRLMAQRSGARLRRAETMAQARRHLALYRPDAVIVDLGLPDGPGEELIAEIAGAQVKGIAGDEPGLSPESRLATGPILLATSGDPSRRAAALAAGAQDFIAKPVATLAGFQGAIMRHLPGAGQRLSGAVGSIHPDPQALRDDLAHAARLLARGAPGRRAYVLAFLRGLARISHDPGLERAAREAEISGGGLDPLIRAIGERLSQQPQPFAPPSALPD